jgi:hypothetical protein
VIANPNHPILIRLGTRLALSQIENDASLTADQRLAYFHVNSLGVFRDVANEVAVAMWSDPTGRAALNAQAPPSGNHPIIDWILANWKTIYTIAATILAGFGIILPPIP